MAGWKEDLRSLVCINSYTRNKEGVDRSGRLFERWMSEIGFECKRYERELIGDHLLFLSKKSGERKRILLLGHLDTVFPPGTFEQFDDDGEWIYGPGVCDMKGGNVVALEALRKIYSVRGSVEDIDFLLVSDEETGSDDSRSITSEIARDYDYCFVFEAAGRDMELVTGRKGIGTFEITIEGKAAHAGTSYDQGCDANLEAAMKLRELTAMTDLERGSTVNVGRIEGGIGANTVSPSAKLLLELRYADHEEKERLLSGLKETVERSFVPGTSAILTGSIQRDVMEPDSRQADLIKAMERITGIELPTESRGGVSDANITASAGTVTIDGFGPYGDGDHTRAERASLESFSSRISLVSTILLHHQEKGDIK
jgi:glutamate carboxypeptidase